MPVSAACIRGLSGRRRVVLMLTQVTLDAPRGGVERCITGRPCRIASLKALANAALSAGYAGTCGRDRRLRPPTAQCRDARSTWRKSGEMRTALREPGMAPLAASLKHFLRTQEELYEPPTASPSVAFEVIPHCHEPESVAVRSPKLGRERPDVLGNAFEYRS